MREYIIRFLVSKIGTKVAAGLAGLVALLVMKAALFATTTITSFSPALGAATADFVNSLDQAKICLVIWIGVMAAVHAITNRYLTKDAAMIQDTLNKAGASLNVDGWAGPKTLAALQQALPVDWKDNASSSGPQK